MTSCVICKTSLESSGYYICKKCNKVCKIVHNEISEDILDLKSGCCNSDIDMQHKMTCSKFCHDKFIIQMIEKYGLFKKVVDATSGISYKVPTRLIIEEGIKQEDLKNYSIWE